MYNAGYSVSDTPENTAYTGYNSPSLSVANRAGGRGGAGGAPQVTQHVTNNFEIHTGATDVPGTQRAVANAVAGQQKLDTSNALDNVVGRP